MKCRLLLTSSLFLAGCHNPQDVSTDVSKSHVQANVPSSESFDEFLTQDLNNYFCRGSEACKTEHEFLRNGPTQSGTSYPKYYLWVKIFKAGTVVEEGALRVAAVEQKRFDVTHFLSREKILQSRSQVEAVFPAVLVDKIVEKARSTTDSKN